MLDINEIYCMDCQDGMKLMPDATVDLVITDPPYDVDYNKKSEKLSKFDQGRDKQIQRDKSYQEFNIKYVEFARELYRVLKDNTHCYLFCGEKQLTLWYDALLSAGFRFSNILIWIKNRQTLDLTFGLKYNYQSEFCIFVRKGVRKLRNLGLSNCLFYNTGVSLKHPCQKPEDMIRFLVNNSSDPGEIVFDPFMGSGTTAVACQQTHRSFLGFEISESYVNLVYDRLKQKPLSDWLEVLNETSGRNQESNGGEGQNPSLRNIWESEGIT